MIKEICEVVILINWYDGMAAPSEREAVFGINRGSAKKELNILQALPAGGLNFRGKTLFTVGSVSNPLEITQALKDSLEAIF